jgi:hypothetical protein
MQKSRNTNLVGALKYISVGLRPQRPGPTNKFLPRNPYNSSPITGRVKTQFHNRVRFLNWRRRINSGTRRRRMSGGTKGEKNIGFRRESIEFGNIVMKV